MQIETSFLLYFFFEYLQWEERSALYFIHREKEKKLLKDSPNLHL